MEKYFDWAEIDDAEDRASESKIGSCFNKCVGKGKEIYDNQLSDAFAKIKEECGTKGAKVKKFFKENEKARFAAIIAGAFLIGIIIGRVIARKKHRKEIDE